MLDRATLKQEARDVLGRAIVSPYLFTLLLLAFSLVLDTADWYVKLPATVAQLEDLDPQLALALPAFVRSVSFPRLPGMFIQIMVTLLSITLGAGASLYHLGIRRGEEMPFGVLFDGFGMVGRVVTLGMLRALLVYLGSLLFVVPGIIAAYRYRFAMYDLLEDPNLSPIQALRMSAAQTAGFKWQLFMLDLSFLGWNLLSALTMGVLSIWLNPYIQQTDVGFFQSIKRIKGIGYFPEDHRPGNEPYDFFS